MVRLLCISGALMAMKKETRDESGVMASWDLNSVDPCYLEHGRLLPRRLYHGAAYMIQLYRLCYFMQVKTLHQEKKLEMLIDRNLKGCFDPSEVEKATELALQCTQSHPTLRRKMSEVLKVLEGLVGGVRCRGAMVISMKHLRSSLKQWSFQDQDD